jgi:hypothetical protein
VMETRKQDMSKKNLSRLSGGADFVWHCLPPKGRSGGILLGINATVLDLMMIVEGEFYLKFHLCNKIDNFKWILMAVYGPAQDNFKTAFLSELVRACQQNTLPTIIGGDFNILRHRKEKNNDRFNDRWPFLFNVVIDSFDLREIELTGRQFTWANSLPNPTFEKLDRVLMTTEWEFKYPLVSVRCLDRGISDHAPLLLDMGTPAFAGNGSTFRLELSWLTQSDFIERVTEIWNRPARGNNAVQRWNNKISVLRRYLRGWAKHKFGIYKQAKHCFQQTIDHLDITAENRDLSPDECLMLAQARDQLARLLREEEIKFYQRAKVTDVLLGDNNMKYFQMIANGKHRKKRIFSLDSGNGIIEGQGNLKSNITQFYKGLFGEPEQSSFSLEPDRIDGIPQVAQAENAILTAPFTEEEVKAAIFQMEHNKAPGPDGFPAEFLILSETLECH